VLRRSRPAVTAFPVATGDRSHDVTINELLTMANIALGGADISSCAAGDQNDDARITIDELLTAVNNALNDCP